MPEYSRQDYIDISLGPGSATSVADRELTKLRLVSTNPNKDRMSLNDLYADVKMTPRLFDSTGSLVNQFGPNNYDYLTLSGNTGNNLSILEISTEWSKSGGQSYKLVPNGNNNDTYMKINGDIGGLRNGMRPGKTYTVIGTRYIPTTFVGAFQAGRVAGIRSFTKNQGGSYVESGPSSGINAGVADLKHTFTLDPTAIEAFVRIYCGSNSTSDTIYWDNLALFEGTL